ncbi:dienelactone hydrolase family protein [Microbulbifer thermotolerans]|uniref:Dienelactone hydrolase family protein n=1 Tax=Microbulbifer thermotolerans TaxID=252514 RepID=A0AB35I0U8_MICTH|nr:dienelactone hydrolase family protein [Microbulbifer thermotolerans]MCX2802382.1 dienelactone hydrolase family protein [Microbulbifer thermotolerans]
MCDEDSNREAEAYYRRHGMTRRAFGKTGLGAALAMMLPWSAWAQEVKESKVVVETPDGEADAYFVHPAKGRHPAVIMWPDIFGMRPAFRQMGRRLAESGYAVLVVNPYYRSTHAQLIPDEARVIDPDLRKAVWPRAKALAGTLSPATCVTDGRAFVRFLDRQPSVDTGKRIGVVGYCMTGSYTFRLAADMPERIGAGASFHGGGLVTDGEDSPHRLVPEMKAGFLIAIAQNDDERDPGAKTALRTAFDSAELPAEIEVYEGTLHGWCPPDSAVYNREQAERAWGRLQALLARNLS